MLKKLLTTALLFFIAFTLSAQSPNVIVNHFPTLPCVGNPVAFTAYDANSVLNPNWAFWWWSFGDGTNAQTQNPTHTYTAPGLYTVNLYVSDSINSDTIYRHIWVDTLCNGGADLITGHAWHDDNQNGIQDGTESDLPFQQIQVNPGGFIITTDQNGDYGLYLPAGSYTITALPMQYWGVISPSSGSYSVTSTGNGSTQSGNDFGIDITQNVDDVVVSMYASPPVPGFNRIYHVHIYNAGTNSLAGTVDFTPDPVLTYVSSNNSGTWALGSVTWTYSGLGLMQGQWFSATMGVPVNATLGDTLKSYASATPSVTDVNPSDNMDTLCQVVVGSYDPNDKTAYPITDSAGHISQNQKLTYRVRFQNTGTWYATLVTVRDTLDANLDLSTFRMLGASHAYTYSIDQQRVVTWTFSGINLPDSNTNEPASHGHLNFSIKPLPNLPAGTQINNRVGIYFDFNPVVLTNTTLNTIDIPNSIEAEINDELQAIVFPNPMTHQATLRFESKAGMDYSFRLLSPQGKVVKRVQGIQNGEFILDRGNLPAGVYFFQLQGADGSKQNGKVVLL